MAHPGAPGRPRHRPGARRGAVRPRRSRPARAGADLRCRHHRRPLGHAAAGRARRRRAAPCLRGLRALVGAGAPLPDRARCDPRDPAGPPRPEGRQRVHPGQPGRFRPACIGGAAVAALRPDCADRLRVLAGLGREAGERVADRAPDRLRVPVAAAAGSARRRPARRSAADAAARLALRRLQPGRHAAALPARPRGPAPRRLDRGAPRPGARAGAPPARSA